ncbi:restriction endonuclease-related protein [Tractidigestivibacter scatoligenes]|jgi:hypothetical protein|uniref:restriction endonuclease-related protein n=1 Tax=Tractidigestivibacter scatoligenes TaxID=1299998 RepID=UPI002F356B90
MDTTEVALATSETYDARRELSVIWHASARAALSLTDGNRTPGVKPRSSDCYHAHVRFLRILHDHGAPIPSDALGTDAFVRHYLTRPFTSWFEGIDGLEDPASSVAEEADIPLLCIGRDDDLYPYDPEVIDDVNARLLSLEELEEDVVFRLMRGLSQDGYVAFRRFEVENPLLRDDPDDAFRLFVRTLPPGEVGNRLDVIGEVIESRLPHVAYERIPDSPGLVVCPDCGWTYDRARSSHGRPCACVTSWSAPPDVSHAQPVSEAGFKYRLQWGPMQWHCLPGKLEVELRERARHLGVAAELWPDHDFCDLRVDLGDEVLLVDVKVYSSTDDLARRIAREVSEKLASSQATDGSRFLFVVPSGHYAYPKETIARLQVSAGSAAEVMDSDDFLRRLRRAAERSADGGSRR